MKNIKIIKWNFWNNKINKSKLKNDELLKDVNRTKGVILPENEEIGGYWKIMYTWRMLYFLFKLMIIE